MACKTTEARYGENHIAPADLVHYIGKIVNGFVIPSKARIPLNIESYNQSNFGYWVDVEPTNEHSERIWLNIARLDGVDSQVAQLSLGGFIFPENTFAAGVPVGAGKPDALCVPLDEQSAWLRLVD